MKLPVVNITISLNEIPDYIAVAIEFGNCKQRCKGCHSPWNGICLKKDTWMELEDVMYQVNKYVKQGAKAIVLMGGTNNGIPTDDLIKAINILGSYAPIGIYSGLEDNADIHKLLKTHTKLQWLKTGSYKAKLGGLDSPTTNQKFWEYNHDLMEWIDRTYLFQQRKEKPIEKD